MNTDTDEQSFSEREDGIDIRKIFYQLLANWYWLAISVFICIGIAFVYLRYKTPNYNIAARVLVNDEKKGGGMLSSSNMLGDLGGLLGAKSTVDN